MAAGVLRAVLVLSVVGALVAALLLTLVWMFQRHLIYLPSGEPVGSVAAVLPGAREVDLHTTDGLRLGAWFVAAAKPDRNVVVLVANGNAGDRADRAPLARALSRRGLHVLLFDYRGYGGNPGSPSEAGLALDARAALRYLTHEAGWDRDRILYYGESLGTAVVSELAAEHPPAGLVLRSPFVDLTSVGRLHYPFLPVGTLLRDRYPLVEHLAAVDAPVTVVYGSEDVLVPPAQSQAVAESAPELHRRVEVTGAGHNDRALLTGTALVEAVVDLAEKATARR